MSQKEILLTAIQNIAAPLSPIPTTVEPTTPPISGIKAVIFDIYGTLLVSGSGEIGTTKNQGTIHSIQRAFDYAHISVSSAAAAREAGSLFKKTILSDHKDQRKTGVDFPEIEVRSVWRRVFATLKERRLLNKMPDLGAIELFSVVYESVINPGWLMPNYHRVLTELEERNLILGIVSNAQFFTPIVLEALSGKPFEASSFYPECIIMSYQLLEAKPSQRLFCVLADVLKARFEIEPAQALYIGNDMKNDVLPASRLYFKTALFAGDRRSYRPRIGDPLCEDVTPDRVVTDLLQILDIVVSGS